MSPCQFRFGYFTDRYEETVSFYRDRLGFPLLESWDRNQDDRGSLFSAASGVIEVIARPTGPSPHSWDDRPPQGAFMVVEVTDIDARFRVVVAEQVSIVEELSDRSWGTGVFPFRSPAGSRSTFFRRFRCPAVRLRAVRCDSWG